MKPVRDTRLPWIAMVAVAAWIVAADAAAGPPQERDGFWIGVALGGGAEADACGQCERGDREWGFAGDLRAGWAVKRNFLLGGEVNFWRKGQDGVTLTVFDVLGTATFYPIDDSGLFLKAGIGGAFTETSYRVGDRSFSGSTDGGLGLMAGTGFDVRIGRNASITPGLTYWRGDSIQRGAGDVLSLNEFSYDVIEISVGFTLH